MTLFYLDTSAFVKRYRAEIGTELIDALFTEKAATDLLASSFLSVLEMTSVVNRLRTAREIRGDPVFVSADHDLLRAASQAGLECIDPAQSSALQQLEQLRKP